MTTTTPGKLVASPQALAALARLRATAAAPALVANPPKTAQPSAPVKPAPAPDPAAQQKAAVVADQKAKRARRAQANDLVAVLRARWLLAFAIPRPPLAIGIDKEIRAALGEAIDPATLRLAIGSWVRRVDYLEAVVRGEPRRNLDGTLGDQPSEDARQECGGARDRGLARTRGKGPDDPGFPRSGKQKMIRGMLRRCKRRARAAYHM